MQLIVLPILRRDIGLFGYRLQILDWSLAEIKSAIRLPKSQIERLLLQINFRRFLLSLVFEIMRNLFDFVVWFDS